MADRERGTCPRCFKSIPLRLDGRLASHRRNRRRSSQGGYTDSYLDGPPPKCGGSSEEPIPVTG